MAKGGAVRQDPKSDTPAKKMRPDRQWGQVEPIETPKSTPFARGGGVKMRRPPKPKIAAIPKKDKPVSTPNPYDYEQDEGTAPPAAAPPLPSGPGGTPPLAGPGMAKGGKWIQGAIKHPGALHKQMGIPQGQPIPEKRLAKAAKAPGKLGARARLAETLKGMHKNKGGSCDDKMAKGGACPPDKMADGGKFDPNKAPASNLPTHPKKFAAGGAAKQRKGFPNTIPPPKKMAQGGKIRGCGIATKGCNFSGVY
jgi:hypothetical protein